MQYANMCKQKHAEGAPRVESIALKTVDLVWLKLPGKTENIKNNVFGHRKVVPVVVPISKAQLSQKVQPNSSTAGWTPAV
jgi:hypothetical protein